MDIIADLHIHGRYSRGCSTDLNIGNLEKYAKIKGVGLLGTGDFTHPLWFRELRDNLTEEGTGFLRTKAGFPFVLQTEISLIYTQGRGRKVHNLVLAPDFATAEQITGALLKHGRTDYDGRPIFKIPCPDFVRMLRQISQRIEVIPAHIWTPHFSMFGSNSGFDSITECFGSMAGEIHAVETGLSSDPPMNWRLSQLDGLSILSFSDLHSYWPWRIGREATVFDIEPSYDSLINAIRTSQGIKGTIEVDPNYGKYHFDGHRNCGVVLDPTASAGVNRICPVCRQRLTVGVLSRVEELADRPPGYRGSEAKTYRHLLPLHEIISAHLDKGIATQAVWKKYHELLSEGKNEFDVLMEVPRERLARHGEVLAGLIIKNREGSLSVSPGYDGVYGSADFSKAKTSRQAPESRPMSHPQKGLSEYFN